MYQGKMLEVPFYFHLTFCYSLTRKQNKTTIFNSGKQAKQHCINEAVFSLVVVELRAERKRKSPHLPAGCADQGGLTLRRTVWSLGSQLDCVRIIISSSPSIRTTVYCPGHFLQASQWPSGHPFESCVLGCVHSGCSCCSSLAGKRIPVLHWLHCRVFWGTAGPYIWLHCACETMAKTVTSSSAITGKLNVCLVWYRHAIGLYCCVCDAI